MRRYNTQEEYDNDICSLPSDVLSVILENDKVNYGVETKYVIINKGNIDEHIYIFSDGIIPKSYFKERTDIETVEIGCGIETIDNESFYLCNALQTVIVHGNINLIGDFAFYGSEMLTRMDYYGTKTPSNRGGCGNNWKPNSLKTINVKKDVNFSRICGTNLNKVL